MEGRSRIDVFISQSMIVGIDEVLEGERGKNLFSTSSRSFTFDSDPVIVESLFVASQIFPLIIPSTVRDPNLRNKRISNLVVGNFGIQSCPSFRHFEGRDTSRTCSSTHNIGRNVFETKSKERSIPLPWMGEIRVFHSRRIISIVSFPEEIDRCVNFLSLSNKKREREVERKCNFFPFNFASRPLFFHKATRNT